MNNTIETIVKHPIASTIIITSITRGIASIVAAAKSGNVNPIVTITNAVKEGVKV